MVNDLATMKRELQEDNVERTFFQDNCVSYRAICQVFDDVFDQVNNPPTLEPQVELPVPFEPFSGTGREERLELQFGVDNDFSAVTLRRFVERYRVVKQINMQGKITGWDSPQFRASKLKLGLVNDPFDWEPKEDLSEYLMRLRRLVKEAYDGDNQPELDKRVPWKFVSGVQDKQITKKLMETGWMLDKRHAKPLEELLKLAEGLSLPQTYSNVGIARRSTKEGGFIALREREKIHPGDLIVQGPERRRLVQWLDKDKNSKTSDFALMDTGAQWTLISAEKLSRKEKEGLCQSDLSGQGVSGEKIPILGEIWRDVQVGSNQFLAQRFVVVQKMICPVILGMDFWSRATELSFNFPSSTFVINNDETEIRLYSNPHQGGGKDGSKKERRPCEVLMAKETKIPPKSEVVVACLVPRMKEGQDYLVEPVSLGERWVGTPYGIVNADSITGNIFSSQGSRNEIDWSKMICSDLDANKKVQLTQLLQGYRGSFYTGGKLPIVRVGVEHSVRLKEDSSPTTCKPRRLSKSLADEVRDHIEKLQKMGVVQESNSIWASPVVCARRNDGSLRLVIDYRMTNAKSTTATLHLIPLIDDLLDRLGKAKYFGTIDAKSGYHQMPMKKEDAEITAFVVPWGHYEFADRTPFGLKGAGYSFQRMMSGVLGSSNYMEALCYLDDELGA
ncbi:hypothetical protein ACHWQZ_G010459 [Mnemiopsis leidyi]